MPFLKQAKFGDRAEFNRIVAMGLREMGVKKVIKPKFVSSANEMVKTNVSEYFANNASRRPAEKAEWLKARKTFFEWWGRQGKKAFIEFTRTHKPQDERVQNLDKMLPKELTDAWMKTAVKNGLQEKFAMDAYKSVLNASLTTATLNVSHTVEPEMKKKMSVYLLSKKPDEAAAEAGHFVYYNVCKARKIKPNDTVSEFFDAAFQYTQAPAKMKDFAASGESLMQHEHFAARRMLYAILTKTKDPAKIRRAAYKLAEKEIKTNEELYKVFGEALNSI